MFLSSFQPSITSPFTTKPTRPGFTLSSLWAGGLSGLYYDATTFNGLYQENYLANPATSTTQPVGAMMDKSKSSSWAIANNLVWTKTAGDGVVTVDGNKITVTGATTTTYVTRTGGDMPFVTGLARMVIRADYTSATGVNFWLRGSPDSLANGVQKTSHVSLNNSSFERLDVSTGTVTFTIIELSSWKGYHAYQSTAASKPTVNARKNTLIRSEEFENSAWQKTGGFTSTPNVALAPNGTMTASNISFTVGGGWIYQAAVFNALVGMVVSFTYYVKSNSPTTLTTNYNGLGQGANNSLGNTITNTNSNWQRVVHTKTVAASDTGLYAMITGIPGQDFQLWGAQVEIGLPTSYQRVVTATTYDNADAIKFLTFDGNDDSISTAPVVLGVNMDCFVAIRFKVAPTDDAVIGDGTTNFILAVGAGADLSRNAGTPTYSIDNIAVSNATTRTEVTNKLGVDVWHILAIKNTNLSSWTTFGVNTYTGWTVALDIAAIVLCPAQTDVVRTKIIKLLGSKVGLSI